MDREVVSARAFPAASFAGSLAVVTGGGTGLGLEIARGLCALGARVVIASRKSEHHAGLLEEAARRGWQADALCTDVREAPRVHELADEIERRHGPADILVNNAAGNFVCPAERLSANAWRAVLSIVLDGTFYCSREFGRQMLARGSGSILNVVATYAWTGMPGVVHSASAKAGVLAMTRTLAAEWADRGLRVNAIAPGPFHSEGARQNLWPDPATAERMRETIPLARFGTAEEVATHALWLLSPASSWVTGECFVVDGGQSLPSSWQGGERGSRSRPSSEGSTRGDEPEPGA